MKIIFGLFVCLLFGFSVFGQTEKEETGTETGVEEINFARDDGSGKAGETVENFVTTDVPAYFLIQLDSAKSANVKMNLVAVKANGLKPGTILVAVAYKTSGKQTRVAFNASPGDAAWSAGAYRVDVFVDGKLAKSREFKIEKSPAEKAAEKPAPPQTVPKSKTPNRRRKN